jgi:cytochrome c peroxidase
MNVKYFLLTVLSVFLLTSIACNKDDDDNNDGENGGSSGPTPYEIKIPKGFPTDLNIPEDNPMTVEGVKLGRYLYYDGRLSGRADEGKPMSCSSCHIQKNAFENGVGKGTGLNGLQTYHVMLPHINLVWNPGTYLWNGSVPSIEADVLGTITDPTEFGSTYEKVEKAIAAVPMYPPMFKAAFGDEKVTVDRIAKAIAQFMRTQISSDSKFDRVLRGEDNFTTAEQRGLVLFTTEQGADCFHCHGAPGNPLMTTNMFYNNAKDTVFDTAHDRYSVTGDKRDIGAYKATTLRNIELTGPYMHDGRFKTLDEVINFYSEGLVYSEYVHPLMHKVFPPYGHGANLNPQQKADLKAFLLTLTDTVFINNPDLASPF